MLLCEFLGHDAYIGALVTIISIWVGVFTLSITILPFLNRKRYEEVNSKFAEIDSKLERIKRLNEDVDKKIAEINQQTEELDKRTLFIKTQADEVEKRLRDAPKT